MPRIAYGFFCEDLREEVGGRITAIGLSGSQVRISGTPPAFMRVALHIYIENPERQPYAFRFHMSGVGVGEPIDHEGNLDVAPNFVGQNLNIIIPGVVPALGDHDIVATLRIESEPPAEAEFRLGVRFT